MSGYPDLFDLSIWSRLPYDDDETAEFSDWYESFRRKRGFSEIRKDLSKLVLREPRSSQGALLVFQVIQSCWKAHQFQTIGDPMLPRRDKYRASDGKTQLLVANSLNRYLLNSTTLNTDKRGEDGSITFYIQKDDPGPGLETNWLSAPSDSFYWMLRLYLPEPAVFDGTSAAGDREGQVTT
jgi:hypothetical protein